MQVFCGIDWAEDHYDVALVDQAGVVLTERRIDDDFSIRKYSGRIRRWGCLDSCARGPAGMLRSRTLQARAWLTTNSSTRTFLT